MLKQWILSVMLHVDDGVHIAVTKEGTSHNAAAFLFDFGLNLGLEPNIITFACLMGAYAKAPLEKVLKAYGQMVAMGIKPNKAFAEVYLTSVLQIETG